MLRANQWHSSRDSPWRFAVPAASLKDNKK